MSLRDCRSPEARDGEGFSHPCVLDSGNPCRDDDFDILSTTNANIAIKKTLNRLQQDGIDAGVVFGYAGMHSSVAIVTQIIAEWLCIRKGK
ncbi:MAG: hypothetical protein RL563_2811 [Pseudomonadota bacterium]